MLHETFPVGLLGCNCTLLGDSASSEALVIDPGLPQDGGHAHLLARLEALGLRLRQILITHAHIDHIGGALALRNTTGAPIFMHGADLPLLRMMDTQAAWLGIAPPPVASPDATLDDGASVGLPSLGAEVLHTPGHTPGSVCLHFPHAFPNTGLLLAGDTLFAGSVGRTDLPGGNTEQLLRSIHSRLLPLPDTTLVIPGHGPQTTLGHERAHNPFLRGMR